MTDKELRRLKRTELLEIMLEQSQEIEFLQRKLKRAEDRLKERDIAIEGAGSIAEAALKLNHIFEDAQRAADQYLENIRRMSEHQANEMEQKGTEESNG